MENNFKVVQRFDVKSVCKIVFLTDLILVAVFVVPLFVLFSLAPKKEGEAPIFLVIPFLLIVHPLMVTVAAAIGTTIYNFMANKVGGIRVQIDG
jgi:hypothetical protein